MAKYAHEHNHRLGHLKLPKPADGIRTYFQLTIRRCTSQRAHFFMRAMQDDGCVSVDSNSAKVKKSKKGQSGVYAQIEASTAPTALPATRPTDTLKTAGRACRFTSANWKLLRQPDLIRWHFQLGENVERDAIAQFTSVPHGTLNL